jgi:hypothetical protein
MVKGELDEARNADDVGGRQRTARTNRLVVVLPNLYVHFTLKGAIHREKSAILITACADEERFSRHIVWTRR